MFLFSLAVIQVQAAGESPSLKWAFDVGALIYSSPAVGTDGTVYIGSWNAVLYALNGSTGSKLWQFSRNRGGSIYPTPVVGRDGTVYTDGGNGWTLHALDGANGNQGWFIDISSAFITSPALGSDGTLYLGGYDGTFAAYNSTNGAVKWRFTAGGAVRSSPALYGALVYFGSDDQKFYALRQSNGAKVWEFSAGGAILSSPAIGIDGTVYFCSVDRTLYAVDGLTGAKFWEAPNLGVDFAVTGSPVLGADGTVYLAVNNGAVAIDGSSGERKWTYSSGDYGLSIPAVTADNTVYVGVGQSLYAFNGGTGEAKWGYVAGGNIRTAISVGEDGTVYFGSENGYVYAITGSTPLASSSWPKFHADLQNTGRANVGTNPPPRYTLRVSAVGNGTVTRIPNLTTYESDSLVTLTAHPESTHRFLRWSGITTSSVNPLQVTMTTNKTITANFISTVLNLSLTGSGTVSRDPSRSSYDIGEQVSLTAVPGRWFAFGQWSDGATANPRTITIGASNTYAAFFSPTTVVETLTFSNVSRIAPVGMPAIFVDGEFVTNSTVLRSGQADVSILTTFPNGAIFYTLDGTQPSVGSALYSGNLMLHRSALLRTVAYDANFAKSWEADPLQIDIEPLYTVYAYVYDGGAVSVTPSKPFYRSNDMVTITAIPETGWQLVQWLGDASGSELAVTIRMTRNICLHPVFGTTLRAVTAGSGSVLVDPGAPLYPWGTSVRLTAIPEAGHYFGAWGNAASSTNNPLLFTVSGATQTISAVFAPLSTGQSALTIFINGHGQVTTTPRANRYAMNQSVTLRAIADADQIFLGWTGNASGTQTNVTVLMNQSKVITANFTARPMLSVESCGGGWTADGFRLTLTGDLGVRYEIQRSSNAVEWVPWSAITNLFGVTQVLDSTELPGQRFYRAVAP